MTSTAAMVESQVANMPRVSAAAGRHGGPTVASYHCSQTPFISVMVRVWGDWRRKGLINADAPESCENDEDCPSTLDFHSCVPEESCPEGTRGAPESKGECRDGACVLISEKTHVFDSANRPWLLPFIAEKATGAERDLLLTLIRHASAHQPEHRPSFAEMVEHLDRFEKQKRGN